MKISKLAKKYGFGYSSVCAWVHKKQLPARYIKNGIRSYFDVNEETFKEFIETHKKSPNAPRRFYNRLKDSYKKNNKGSRILLDETVVESKKDSTIESESKLQIALHNLAEFAGENFDTYNITPKQYLRIMRCCDTLKEIINSRRDN